MRVTTAGLALIQERPFTYYEESRVPELLEAITAE